MEDDSLDSIRQKRSEELRQKLEQQQMVEQQEMQLDALLRQALSVEAKTRLSNVRLVNKELYYKTAQAIAYLAQSGKLQQKISDPELKLLLERLQPKKKEISIKRK